MFVTIQSRTTNWNCYYFLDGRKSPKSPDRKSHRDIVVEHLKEKADLESGDYNLRPPHQVRLLQYSRRDKERKFYDFMLFPVEFTKPDKAKQTFSKDPFIWVTESDIERGASKSPVKPERFSPPSKGSFKNWGMIERRY